jgi:hypothetical protein
MTLGCSGGSRNNSSLASNRWWSDSVKPTMGCIVLAHEGGGGNLVY